MRIKYEDMVKEFTRVLKKKDFLHRMLLMQQ